MRAAILILVLAGFALGQESREEPEPDAAGHSRRAVAAAIPLLEDLEHSAAAYRVVTRAWDPKRAHEELLRQMDEPDVAVGRTYLRALIETSEREPGAIGMYRMSPDWLPPSYRDYLPRLAEALPRKRGAALAISLQSVLLHEDAFASSADAVVRVWPTLHDAQRAMYLGEYWEKVRSPELTALLEPFLNRPAKFTEFHVEGLRSLAVQRLLESGSEEARAVVLADMKLLAPTLAWCALGALPDEALPEFEETWTVAITGRDGLRATGKLAMLIERYATKGLQPVVLATLRSAKWACSIQEALLRFLMKHDREIGLAEVRAALLRRGKGETGCYRAVIQNVLPPYWGPDAQALTIECLADPDRDVVRGAVDTLSRSGSVDCVPALLDLAATADDEGPQVYSAILNAVLISERWELSPELRKRLWAVLHTEYARTHFRARFGK